MLVGFAVIAATRASKCCGRTGLSCWSWPSGRWSGHSSAVACWGSSRPMSYCRCWPRFCHFGREGVAAQVAFISDIRSRTETAAHPALFFGVFPPSDAATVSAGAGVLVEADSVNASSRGAAGRGEPHGPRASAGFSDHLRDGLSFRTARSHRQARRIWSIGRGNAGDF